MFDWVLNTLLTVLLSFTIVVPWCRGYLTNTPRVFHVETTWKRSFPRRFNVEYTWNLCRLSLFTSIPPTQDQSPLIFVRAKDRAHILLFYNCTTKQFIIIISSLLHIITIIFIITIILLYSVLVRTNVTHVFQYFSQFSYFSTSSLPGHKTSFNPLGKVY